MLANIIAKLGTKVLIIAHLSVLIQQLSDELEAVLGEKPVILNANSKVLGDINIATSQFISMNPDVWYQIKNDIGLLVVDEAESLASKTTMRIFQRAYAKYHMFISATFSRSTDNRTGALVDFAGTKQIALINPKLLKPSVMCIYCPEVFYPPMHKSAYQKAKLNFFTKESIDLKIIAIIEASLKKNRQVLVACDVVPMQERLADKLNSLGIVSVTFNGKTSAKDRNKILKEYNDGTIKVLIGLQVLNAGLSIPRISTIIRVSTPSSREKLEQLIGRARRDYEGKDGCFIIDLFIRGFSNTTRLSLYKRKQRQEQWSLSQSTWEDFQKRL